MNTEKEKPPPSYDNSMSTGGYSNPNYEQQQDGYPPIIHPLPAHNALPSYDESEQTHVDAERNWSATDGIVDFSEKSIRLGFVRKVFAIVMMQMVVTIGMTSWFMFHEPTRDYVQQSQGMYIGAYVTFIVLYFVLVCCTKVARQFPVNLILLAVFTLAIGYLVAAVSTFHDTKIVLAAFGMTTVSNSSALLMLALLTSLQHYKERDLYFCSDWDNGN